MTGNWKGRGNQYFLFVRLLYCKLPTNGKQLPAFPLEAVSGTEPRPQEVGGESVTTLPPWPLVTLYKVTKTLAEANIAGPVNCVFFCIASYTTLLYFTLLLELITVGKKRRLIGSFLLEMGW